MTAEQFRIILAGFPKSLLRQCQQVLKAGVGGNSFDLHVVECEMIRERLVSARSDLLIVHASVFEKKLDQFIEPADQNSSSGVPLIVIASESMREKLAGQTIVSDYKPHFITERDMLSPLFPKLVESLSFQGSERKKRARVEHFLRERKKEPTGFYDYIRIAQKDLPIEETLLECANALPAAFQYPEITCARIVMNKAEFKTENFKNSPWCLSADFEISEAERGRIEVYYLEERETAEEGPFLREERDLLDYLAAFTGDMVQAKKNEARVLQSEEQLRFMFRYAPDAMYIIDSKGVVRDGNLTAEDITGYHLEEAVGKSIKDFRLLRSGQMARAFKMIATTLMGKKGGPEEYQIIRKDGALRDLEVTTFPVKMGARKVVYGIARDITKRKAAEEELKAQKRRFQALLSRLAGMLYRCPAETPWQNMSYISRGVGDLTGFSIHEFTGAGKKKYYEMIYSEDRERVLEEIKKYAQSEKKFSLRYRIHCRSGQIRYVWEQGETIREPDGTFSIESLVTDVNEATAAAEALRESEARFRSAFHDSPLGMAIMSLKGFYTTVNRAFCAMTGYSAEELTELGYEDLTHPEDKEKLEPVMSNVFSGKVDSIEIEKRFQTKEKKTIWVTVAISAVKSSAGEVLYFVEQFQDMTERRLAEEKLKKLSRAVEQSLSLIIITDKKGGIEYVNPRFLEVTGYTAEEVLGKNPRFLKTGHTSREEYEEIWKTILTHGTWQGEFLNKKKDGKNFWVSVTLSAVRDSSGEISHFLGVQEEITEKKKAERLFRDQEMIETKTRLISVVSHELRTPLTIIQQSVDTVLSRAAGEISKNQEDFLQVANRNINRLARMINDFLDYHKLDMGRMTFKKERFNLNELIESIADAERQIHEGLDVKFVVESSSEPCPSIEFDRDRITQVFLNLIQNARHFTHEGTISVGCEPFEDGVRCWVSDTGIGIKRTSMKQLFTTFGQIDDDRHRKTGGTGLGLAISKMIIEGHGGRIWAESEEGKGSTFSFYIPAHADNVNKVKGAA